MKLETISARVPDYAIPDFIAYCERHRMTQSEVIRRAIARYVEADESASNYELAMAAVIEDSCRSYSPRTGREIKPRTRRWASHLMEQHRMLHDAFFESNSAHCENSTTPPSP